MARARLLAALAVAAAAVGLALPGGAGAAVDPAGCTPTLQYDPTIPTFTQFATEHGYANTSLGGFQTGTADRHESALLYGYEEALAAATASNPRARVIVRGMGKTFLGRDFQYAVVGTAAHLEGLESDAAFWRGVRDGSVSEATALADVRSADPTPAFGWITETPHGNEPAGGEASIRMLYELVARTDCANAQRLASMDFFIDPARNPDGRDNNTRTTAWAFDPNRDLMYQTQDVNQQPLDTIYQYPGLFFIDAHQQSTGYFFPPNEDPVHHEVSHFALNEIQNVIGPALQSRFNDQSLQYRNYNEYDLFTPEYGDTVPSLILGAAGMTYEKGDSENYGKQVYDHYLAMDETANVVAKEERQLAEGWIAQWGEAAAQGASCKVQENVLVSPLHDRITQQPDVSICGYYFLPGNHAGDTAHIVRLLQGRGVRVFRLDQSVTVGGAHEWGSGEAAAATGTETLPAGTLWIPTAQPMKHWINATLEENPYIPYPYFYDIVDWAMSQLSDAGGNGQLQAPLPAGTAMTAVTGEPSLGGVSGSGSVYAFPTDSMESLGLITELLALGVDVDRAGPAFDAAGTHFPTGAALVDASSLGSVDLDALARNRQTPVTALGSYPVAHYALAKPKIAVYTGATTIPTNPLYKGGESGQCRSSGFCEMLFGLAIGDRIPNGLLTPVTSTEVTTGALVAGNYTALVMPDLTTSTKPGSTPEPPDETAIREFVNGGGNLVGQGTRVVSVLRSAGMTNLNTSSTKTWNAHCPDNLDPAAEGELTTPGTTFSAEFDTDDPVAWGFDRGGYIYRNSSGNPVFDPASLAGSGAAIPNASAAVSYPHDLRAYGYQCNALNEAAGDDHLPGRPYAVDQDYGAGHFTVIGSNAYFRDWNWGGQRLALNAVLYPQAAPAGPSSASASASSSRAAPATAREPLPRRRMLPVKDRPAVSSPLPRTDAVVTVKAKKAGALRRVVAAARLPAAVRRNVEFIKAGRRFSLRIDHAASFSARDKGDPSTVGQQLWVYDDLELRPLWAWRIIRGLVARRLHTLEHRI